MDLWAVVLRQFRRSIGINIAFVGRWIGQEPFPAGAERWSRRSRARARRATRCEENRRSDGVRSYARSKLGVTFSGIAILLSGHTHNRLDTPVFVNDTLICSRPPYSWGSADGSCTIAHLATGDGSRDRIEEDVTAGLQLLQEPGHSHGLRPRYVPRGARDGFARPHLLNEQLPFWTPRHRWLGPLWRSRTGGAMARR